VGFLLRPVNSSTNFWLLGDLRPYEFHEAIPALEVQESDMFDPDLIFVVAALAVVLSVPAFVAWVMWPA
jgi:hypothetical protein